LPFIAPNLGGIDISDGGGGYTYAEKLHIYTSTAPEKNILLMGELCEK
tara:strand:+ start:386 stop:529 length:144 start_codon:yes stop_codon:yes gene_type:complete